MNKVILVGRLVRDPNIRYSQGETPICVARYTLAVDRVYKTKDGVTADFISCTAFGRTGEFVEKYLRQGMKIGVIGRITTGSYEKNGQKVYTTEVTVEEHEFVESKSSSNNNISNNDIFDDATKTDDEGFTSMVSGIADDIPF